MISYFKYTAGESFTLNGDDYSGFFTVVNGSAYTGKSITPDSRLLVSKDTLLANCYLAKKEFDRTAAPVRGSNVIALPEISPRNVIDQNFLNKNLGILNDNNLNLYSLNLNSDINLINFEDSFTDGTSYFLGVSSGSSDLQNTDTSLSKDNAQALQIVPFSHTDRLGRGIDDLDNTVDSVLLVNGDKSYKYITTTTTGSQTLCGTFATNGSLKQIMEGEFPADSALTYNDNTQVLYNIAKELVPAPGGLGGRDLWHPRDLPRGGEPGHDLVAPPGWKWKSPARLDFRRGGSGDDSGKNPLGPDPDRARGAAPGEGQAADRGGWTRPTTGTDRFPELNDQDWDGAGKGRDWGSHPGTRWKWIPAEQIGPDGGAGQGETWWRPGYWDRRSQPRDWEPGENLEEFPEVDPRDLLDDQSRHPENPDRIPGLAPDIGIPSGGNEPFELRNGGRLHEQHRDGFMKPWGMEDLWRDWPRRLWIPPVPMRKVPAPWLEQPGGLGPRIPPLIRLRPGEKIDPSLGRPLTEREKKDIVEELLKRGIEVPWDLQQPARGAD